MCGRYVSPDAASIEREFNLAPSEWRFAANFNVAPSQLVPAIRAHGTGCESVLLRWGLVPSIRRERPGKYSTFNARSEALTSNALIRGPWSRGQRCIVPALGFYDWHVNADGTRQPFYIRLDDQTVFGFGGLWQGDSCAIVTMPANSLMAGIHNSKARMPVILARDMREPWLFGSAEAAVETIVAYPDEQMIAYPVDCRVDSVANNDEALLDPLDTQTD
jgi:putative SOS response-associated peptidase YedK